MKLRQSTLGSFDACPRRMQYDIEGTTYNGGSIRALGTAYHAGLELYYDPDKLNNGGCRRNMTVQDCIDWAYQVFDDTAALKPSHASEFVKEAGVFKWDDRVPDHDSAYELLTKMLTEYLTNHVWPVDFKVLAVEPSFSDEWRDGHTLNGSIDLVLEQDGFIYGVDHKTAGRMWPRDKESARKMAQSNMYSAALWRMYPDAKGVIFAYDVMTYAGKFERRVSAVTPETMAAFEDKAWQVVSLYTTMRDMGLDLPTNSSSTLCSPKWCDSWDICPMGAALENTV